jgi:uncharacterized protein (DUF1330 family)
MPKGYWITWYSSTVDPAVHAKYADLAGKAITSQGGRFLARGNPAATYESGPGHRSVVIEFDSVAEAIAAYESPSYQAAVAALDGSVKREVRILEGT